MRVKFITSHILSYIAQLNRVQEMWMELIWERETRSSREMTNINMISYIYIYTHTHSNIYIYIYRVFHDFRA